MFAYKRIVHKTSNVFNVGSFGWGSYGGRESFLDHGLTSWHLLGNSTLRSMVEKKLSPDGL